jgi:hypothetical protein
MARGSSTLWIAWARVSSLAQELPIDRFRAVSGLLAATTFARRQAPLPVNCPECHWRVPISGPLESRITTIL